MSHAKGHVYIAVTEAHPGLVKIGFTTRSPEKRIQQFSTGSPVPFRLAYSAPVGNPRGVEQAVHAALHRFRVNQQREFFSVTVQEAITAIHRISEEVRRRDEEIRYRDAVAVAQATLKHKERWLGEDRWSTPVMLIAWMIGLLISSAFFGPDLWVALMPTSWGFAIVASVILGNCDALTNRQELTLLAVELAQQHRVKIDDLPLPKDGLLRFLL
jgi:hypothetical protein